MSFTAKCGECDRVFDMLDENDSGEWSTGHDCEPPKPAEGFGGYQVGFGTIDPAAGPRQGAHKSENADHLYGTIPMLDTQARERRARIHDSLAAFPADRLESVEYSELSTELREIEERHPEIYESEIE